MINIIHDYLLIHGETNILLFWAYHIKSRQTLRRVY